MNSTPLTPSLSLEELQKIKEAIKPILERKKTDVKTSISKIVQNKEQK